MKDYDLFEIKAIAYDAGDTEEQDAILVHLKKDPYQNGDCILFGYSTNEFKNDKDVTDALLNNTPVSCYCRRDDGVYIAGVSNIEDVELDMSAEQERGRS